MKNILRKSLKPGQFQTTRGGGPKSGVNYPHSFSALNSYFNEGYKNHPEEL